MSRTNKASCHKTLTLPKTMWEQLNAYIESHPSFNFSGWVQEHLTQFFQDLEKKEEP